MRLLFAARFLSGVECMIHNGHSTLRVGTAAVWSIRQKQCLRFLKVLQGERLAVEIPSSKLDAHGFLASSTCRERHTSRVCTVCHSPLARPLQPRRVL